MHPDTSDLTDDAIRMKLAAFEGWSQIQYRPSIVLDRAWLSGLNPHPDSIDCIVTYHDGVRSVRPANESDYGWETLPDYPNDLDACHRVRALLETQLSVAGIVEFVSNLNEVALGYRADCDSEPVFWHTDVFKLGQATAREHCLALIKTLNL